MTNDLLLHPKTKLQVDNFISRSSHGLIITAPSGSGKLSLARAVATSLLGLEKDKLDAYAYFTQLNPEGPTITIEEIRTLLKLLNLKTPSNDRTVRRIIIVADAERMPTEAQNAFLKSLEEPPLDTCIILTTEGSQSLLPTIYSRMQKIEVLPVSEAMASSFFNVNKSELSKSYAMSQGQVGLLSSLLSDEKHELKDWVVKAKQLLSQPVSDRLVQVDLLSKDKNGLKLLLNALQRIAHAGLMSASNNGKESAIKHWHAVMGRVQFASDGLARNANTKLLLDDLLLNL